MKYNIGINRVIILSSHKAYVPFVASVGIINTQIAAIMEGKSIPKEECDIWIDGMGKILMPGLVNAHCHGDMTLARGLGDDMTLWEQNQAFEDTNWFHTLITDEDRYYSRQLTYCEALLSGTTFIVENMYWSLKEKSMEAMSEIGIRGALVEDIRADFADSQKLVSDESLKVFIEDCQQKGQIPIIGTVAEEDFELERLESIKKKLSKVSVLQTQHLAENDWRVALIKEKFGTTPIDYLYTKGFLGKEVIGSHVVFATSKEIMQLSESGTKVVNTPLCEMKIGDGIAPIPEMLEQGITVCLGTDGAMWNNSNDIFREMKGMSLLHTVNSGIRSISTNQILDMATLNGAKCFGLENEYGTIEEGKKADFILVETRVPHMQPLRTSSFENVGSSIVFNATGNDVTDVFIEGKRIVKNRKIQNVDLDKIIEKVQQASVKIEKALSM